MGKFKTFVCKRCGEICIKSPTVKRQRYCLNCIKPRGTITEEGKKTYKIWSTSKE